MPRLALTCALASATCLCLAFGAPSAHACGSINPYAAEVNVIWPRDGATDVPIETQVWYRHTGMFTLKLVHAETGEDVTLDGIGIMSLTNEPPSTYTPTGVFTSFQAPSHPLEPETSYTLHITTDDTTTTLAFTTAARTSSPPPPLSAPTPSLYRRHFNAPRNEGDDCYRPPPYNTLRHAQLAPPETDHPVVYTLTDDDGAPAPLINPYAYDGFAIFDPATAADASDLYILLRRDEADPTPLVGACAALAFSVALAHHAPPSHACTTVNTPQPSRADVIWPPNGNGADDIPVRTHIWLSYSGPNTLQLTQTDTGIEIPLTALETRISQVGIGMHPGTYIVRLMPARVLEPETSYTLRLTLNGNTLTQTFSTARSDAPLPSLTHTARPRVYRRHLNRLTHDGGDCYSDPRYNTARYAELEQPHITHPVLYVLDSDKDSADDAHLAQQFGRDFIVYHPTQPHRYVSLKRDEADPYDDPCLTLRWVDVFGREGALDPICTPDACTAPGHDPGGWPFPDFQFYTPELCDLEPTQDDDAPQSDAQDGEDEGEDEDVGCATAPRQPSPALPPLALIALGAWCLRRGRTAP